MYPTGVINAGNRSLSYVRVLLWYCVKRATLCDTQGTKGDTMSHEGNVHNAELRREAELEERTTDGLTRIDKILPEILDEEGITIHSTDDDTPTVGRVTVELVEGSLMDTPLVKSLGEKLDEIEARIDPEIRELAKLNNDELKDLLLGPDWRDR